MALKLAVDTVDGLDDALKALYVEKDGKFVLDVDGIPDDTGLKTALQKERKRADEAEKQAKKWQQLGKSEAEIKELLEAQERIEHDKAAKAGEWDKLKEQMNKAHAEAVKAKDETIGQLRQRLNAELVDAKATAAIAAAKGVPDLLLPHIQRYVKVDENFNVQVVDAKGDPRVNGKGEPLTIADLVSEMKSSDVYGRAFEGSGHSGSGTPPGNGGGGNPQVKRRSDLKNREDRVKFVEEFGNDAYLKLPV